MDNESIVEVLDGLMKHDEFLTCMVVNRELTSVKPTVEKTDVGINKVKNIFEEKMNNVFTLIDIYSKVNLKTMKWTFQDFEIWHYVFPDYQHALVAVVPKLSNEGLIAIELEKARKEIIKLINGNTI